MKIGENLGVACVLKELFLGREEVGVGAGLTVFDLEGCQA